MSINPNQMARCSRCAGPRDRENQRYCRACHNAYVRDWNKSHARVGVPRVKGEIRSFAGYAKRIGVLVAEPCHKCGCSSDVEMHHDDYSKPLDVQWLCRPCHRAHHLTVSRETRRAEVLKTLGAA